MDFHEKIQTLRKQKGLTQEDLAAALYVSRTAISKWESGKGYPNIDSLKAIAAFFHVTVDELLSGDEVLSIAEDDRKRQRAHTRDLLFGLLDCSAALFWVLPFFGQTVNAAAQSTSLLSLAAVSPYLKLLYTLAVSASVLTGLATLTLQRYDGAWWVKSKTTLSLLLGTVTVLLFIISRQPYAAVFAFLLLLIKTLFFTKGR